MRNDVGVGRRRTTWVVLVAAFTLLAGCAGGFRGSGGAAASNEPVRGGTIVVGSGAEMRSFDPVRVTYPGAGLGRAAAVMGTLMSVDSSSGEVRPYMAESMTPEDNGTVWTIKLRQGVQFTDGTPFDADAVIFNLKRHVAPESTSVVKAALSTLTDLTAVDPLTVRLTLSKPNGELPVLLGASPAGLIGSPKALADPGAFGDRPVGAGPFVLRSWVRDDTMELTANPNYWDKGKPYLAGLKFKVVADADTRVNSLASGELQVSQVDARDKQRLSSGFTFYNDSLVGAQVVVINASRGPGADLRFRQALQKAFDPQVSSRLIFGGELWKGDLECLPFTKSAPACLRGVYPKYDPEGAKQLIREFIAAGGVARVGLTAPSSYSRQVQYIQQQLAAIGVEVVPQLVDVAGLATATTSGNFDLMNTALGDSIGYPIFWNRLYNGSPNNWPRTAIPGLNEALNGVEAAVRPEDRNKAWQQVQQVVFDNAVFVPLSPFATVVANSDTVHMSDPGGAPYHGSSMRYFDSAWLTT